MSPSTLFSLRRVNPRTEPEPIRPLRRPAQMAVILAMTGLLSACANMSDTPPGASLPDIEARYGKADYACPAGQGKQRLTWTQQPYGQYAWTTLVDEHGKIDRVVPALTDARFRMLDKGSWTPDQVRCEFGPPAETSLVGLPGSRQVVWSYRYKQDGAWNSLMYIYFGTDGTHMTRRHAGPDPLFDPIELEVW